MLKYKNDIYIGGNILVGNTLIITKEDIDEQMTYTSNFDMEPAKEETITTNTNLDYIYMV
ncbi:MAG TPA: hypothetical protein DCM73_08295 [Clostridiales bacterium]|nr:hypothetical protein [Clostridiales bacterium]